MSVYPESNVGVARMNILKSISFYENAGGSNTFKIGTENKNILMTDEGRFSIEKGDLYMLDSSFSLYGGNIDLGSPTNPISLSITLKNLASVYGNVHVDGNIYADNISSDKKLKENIKDSNVSALDLINKIEHRQFEMKKDGRHYNIGYIAQELEEIDKNFVLIKEKTNKTEQQYYINELPLLATATKAIQELNEKVEQLQNKVNELEKLIEKEK